MVSDKWVAVNNFDLMRYLIFAYFLTVCCDIESQNLRKKLRPLSPDRPHQTESPYTVDRGHIQLETDIGNITHNNLEPQSRSLGFLYFNLKVGIQKRMDLELMSNAYTLTRYKQKNLLSTNLILPDLTFRYKYNIFGNDSGKTCVAIMPFIKTTGFGAKKWGPKTGGLFLNAERELGELFEIGYTGGLTYFTIDNFFKEYELFSTVSFDYKIVGSLHHFVELSDRYNRFQPVRNNYSFDSGITFTPSGNLQFDTGFYYFIPIKLFYFFVGTTIRI
jgi:hypothetical protein